jgi:hypothetical protein
VGEAAGLDCSEWNVAVAQAIHLCAPRQKFSTIRILSPDAINQIRQHFDAINSGRAGARQFDVPDMIMDLIGPSGSLGALATRQAGQAACRLRR